jgi:hypothetical protein
MPPFDVRRGRPETATTVLSCVLLFGTLYASTLALGSKHTDAAFPIRVARHVDLLTAGNLSETPGLVHVVGRYRTLAGQIDFDHVGVRLEAHVTGTKTVTATMSKVGSTEVFFRTMCNGKLSSVFGTSTWAPNLQKEVLLCDDLDPSVVTTVSVQKITEAEWNSLSPSPNYVSFYGLQGDPGMKILNRSVQFSKRRRLEFLGDSITAGFCNQCETKPSLCPAGQSNCVRQESFAFSWANLICEAVDADCHNEAWSGYGMVMNCCGGKTLMSDIYKRTLASVPSGNVSDPHGTTKENYWDFSSWRPDALVINLGTNDRLNSRPQLIQAYNATYLNLVLAASNAYGPNTHFFLACGPMSTAYCSQVQWLVSILTEVHQVKVTFLDQRGFLDGSYGPACCGHPGATVDAAMAKKSADVIKATMGWKDKV